MSLIDILRLVGSLAWGTVFVMRAGSIVRVLKGDPRYYDPLWATIAAIALMIVGYHVHWLVTARSQSVYLGLNVFSLILGLMTIQMVRRYQGVRRDA